MVFKLFLIFSLSFSVFSQEMSGESFIRQLKETGQLGIFDSASISIFNQTCSRVNMSGLEDDLGAFCNIVVKSDICKGLEEDKLLNCSNVNESREFDTIDFLAGCTEGLFNSVKELLSFIWDAMKWVFSAVTHPVDTIEDASEFADSAKLYLINEYDKAYDKVNPPFREVKAMKEMGQAIGGMLLKGISDYLYQEYQEFGCMNFKARTETMCFVAGELIIPPVAALALLKKGPKAVKSVSSGLKGFLNGQRRTLALSKRRNLAQKSLNRNNLTDLQIEKLEEAHLIGKGEVGLNGELAGVGNYTLAQLKRKAKILKDAGFSSDEVRKLMQDGVVGISNSGWKELFGIKPELPKPLSRQQLAATGSNNTDQFRAAYNNGKIEGDTQYISYIDDASGERLPGRIIKDDNGVLTVETLNGQSITLSSEKLDDIRVSSTSREVFRRPKQTPQIVKLETSGDSVTDKFRDAFNNGKIDGDNQYVSFLGPNGDRLPGKVIETNHNGIIVETPSGKRYSVQGDDLNEVRVSSTSRDSFMPEQRASIPRVQENNIVLREASSPNNGVGAFSVPEQISPAIVLRSSGNSNVDAFRRAFNSGRIEGSDQYVSIPYGADRRPARIISQSKNEVQLEVLDQNGNHRRVFVEGDDLNGVRVSSTSRDYFERNSGGSSSPNPVGGYNFSSQKLNDYRSTGGDVIEVNLNSPSLRNWMNEATNIIEKRTGVKPNPNANLTSAQRNQIYRVWLDEIVKKVEDQNFGNYADARQRLLDQNGGRVDLGKILDTQGAVCRELSMFAHVLLSEYGLRSTVMNGIVGTRGTGGGGHAWIQIFDRSGQPLEVLDSNHTRSIHPDMSDYEDSVNGLRMRQTYDLVRPVGQ